MNDKQGDIVIGTGVKEGGGFTHGVINPAVIKEYHAGKAARSPSQTTAPNQ